jgi:hypothetical protein
MAPKYKKDFSRLNVKKRYKMPLKYKNKRREIQENLSNGSYVFLSYYISNIKAHTFYLGQPSYPGKVFTWKIFIPPKRYPASFCRERAKASYSAASCKQSPEITISFYNSQDLAVAE